MVDDENNFDGARDALEGGLEEGLYDLWEETLHTVDENMQEGQDAMGNAWVAIEPETLAQREVRTGDASPMLDTGNLRADIVSTSEFRASKLTAEIASSSVYLPPHEFGWPEAGIPRRPIIGPAGTYAERRSVDVIGEEIDTRLETEEID